MGVRPLITWVAVDAHEKIRRTAKHWIIFLISIFRDKKKESHIICKQYVNNGLNTKLGFPRFYSFFHSLAILYITGTLNLAILGGQYLVGFYFSDFNK